LELVLKELVIAIESDFTVSIESINANLQNLEVNMKTAANSHQVDSNDGQSLDILLSDLKAWKELFDVFKFQNTLKLEAYEES